MEKRIGYFIILIILLAGTGAWSQESGSVPTVEPDQASVTIDGSWVTQTANLVEVVQNGTRVTLTFPDFARIMPATFENGVLVYITHYNDPSKEDCYLDVPDSERAACLGFIQKGDERHRFTLTLSEDGMVFSGTKEINVLKCEWDTDENGKTSNHRPVGYEWQYSSDYQWRRAECDFAGFPPMGGSIIQRFDLIDMMFARFGLAGEFSLGDFVPKDRVKFVYEQSYIDADTGALVPASEGASLKHVEPLDGRVYLDEESGLYMMELYPYSLRSYPSLLTALTMLCCQIHALDAAGLGLTQATTQIEMDSVDYLWSHRRALCSTEDELFDHHIDFLSRALRFRAMRED